MQQYLIHCSGTYFFENCISFSIRSMSLNYTNVKQQGHTPAVDTTYIPGPPSSM